METGRTINYAVYPTPMKPGETEQTYHVRQIYKTTVRTRELAEHIAKHTLIPVELFQMVVERLRLEMAEQLLSGHDLHFDGLGRFALQLGTKKTMGDDGRWHAKVYKHPDELDGNEVVVEGMTFVPDKAMLDLLHSEERMMVRHKVGYRQKVDRELMLQVLGDVCRQRGSFTRLDFQWLFGVSSYRAKKMLNELVAGPDALFCRRRIGTACVYRQKT